MENTVRVKILFQADFPGKHLQYSKGMNRVLHSIWHVMYEISLLCQPKPTSVTGQQHLWTARKVLLSYILILVRIFDMTPVIVS